MARGYRNIRFEWNGKHSVVIKNLGFGKELQRDAAEIMYQNAFDYMPYLGGDLSTIVHIQALGDKANIVHSVPYANKQYNMGDGYTLPNNSNRYTVIHPLATSNWYDFAWKQKKQKITKEIDEARIMYRTFKY